MKTEFYGHRRIANDFQKVRGLVLNFLLSDFPQVSPLCLPKAADISATLILFP